MKELASYRQDKNLRQIDVAKKLKVGQSTVAMWEKGGSYPRPEMLLQLSKLYGIEVEVLIRAIKRKGEANG